MFFKRERKEKTVAVSDSPTETPPAAEVQDKAAVAETVEEPHKDKKDKVEQNIPPSNVIPFAPEDVVETAPPKPKMSSELRGTKDLEPLDGLPGQDAAIESIKLVLAIDRPGMNAIVVGKPGTGRRTAIEAAAKQRPVGKAGSSDLLFVQIPGQAAPIEAIELPQGRASAFADALSRTLRSIEGTLHSIFGSDDFDTTRNVIEEEFRHDRAVATEALRRRAETQNIAMLKTPQGYVLAPMHDGKVVRPEVFSALPEALQKDVQRKIGALETELTRHLSDVPKAEAARRKRLREFTSAITVKAISSELETLRQGYEDQPVLLRFIRKLEHDLTDRASEAIDAGGVQYFRNRAGQYVAGYLSRETVQNSAPIISVSDPTPENVFGHLACDANGDVKVIPGACHRGNGGVVVMDLGRVLASTGCWEALRQLIERREVHLAGRVAAVQSVPFSGKVILVADAKSYSRFSNENADLEKLFPIIAAFRSSISRKSDNEVLVARHLTAIVKKTGSRHLDQSAVVSVLDDAGYRAGESGHLSLDVAAFEALIVEADHYASTAKRDLISADDIERAIKRRDGSAAACKGMLV